MGQLSKLRQTSTVRNYQEQFETLMARTTGLPDEFFVHCFVRGLKEVIKNQVTMFRPTTLPQAIGLALLQEGTMEAIIKEVKGPIKNNTTRVGFSEASKGNNNQLPPIKKIQQLKCKREETRNFVINVMKNMSLANGHRCIKRQIFLLEGEENEEEISYENNTKTEDPIVLVHALFGSVSHQTMRIRGNIKKKAITILLDSGSTHNFLDPVVAKRTGCTIQSTSPMRVAVADGTKLTSDSICKL